MTLIQRSLTRTPTPQVVSIWFTEAKLHALKIEKGQMLIVLLLDDKLETSFLF